MTNIAQTLADQCMTGELRALSIQQPWCDRILFEGKDIENRSWKTKFRGWVLIHASLGVAKELRTQVTSNMPRGGIVGIMNITDCLLDSPSPWFQGPVGFVISNAVPLKFIPCRGSLSFFKPPQDVLGEIASSILASDLTENG